ncbi:conjugal transfer protein TraQ, partial [Salmonella enterica subsp. enterica serovar Infantis]
GFVMNGISIWRKSGLDGHTSLSASESVSKGNFKFIAGVLLVFIDLVLNALLASIGIVF